MHDEPTDEKYFEIVSNTLQVAPAYRNTAALQGKITLPSTVNGQSYNYLGGFNGQSNITHIFIMPNNTVTNITRNAFTDCSKLQYFEWPENLVEIQEKAFRNVALNSLDLSEIYTLTTIGPQAFENSLATLYGDPDKVSSDLYGTVRVDIKLPGTLTSIGKGIFNYINYAYVNSITIGSASDRWNLSTTQLTGSSPFVFAAQNGGHSMELVYDFYVTANVTDAEIDNFLNGSWNEANWSAHRQ